ncbi:MAG: hypothetical protein KDC53_06495 [Saprospiraceae bacterium]|nr:hypothetical protein [Saprospiraceae bacterium]
MKLFFFTLILGLCFQLNAQDIDLHVEGLARIGSGTATSNDAKFDVVGNNGSQIVDGIEMQSIVKFYNQYENGGGFRFLVDSITKTACFLNGRNDADLIFAMRSGLMNKEIVRYKPNGNIGIGTSEPKRKLHINDALRLEPQHSEPESPQEGDIYMNANTHKLMVFDGTVWQACW